MMFAVPSEPYEIDPDFVEALNLLLIVHADHEQNCSTSTVRMVGSSDANLFASISAGICALWGPLHGGANQACVEMLEADSRRRRQREEVRRSGQEEGQRLPPDGLWPSRLQELRSAGHDHQGACATSCSRSCRSTTRSSTSPRSWRRSALTDPYFIERKLYPNVDFYSGVIYRAIGIPVQMFTVLFAMGRLPGWIAHWMEMHHSPSKKICRPRQVYTGPNLREFVSIEKRK